MRSEDPVQLVDIAVATRKLSLTRDQGLGSECAGTVLS